MEDIHEGTTWSFENLPKMPSTDNLTGQETPSTLLSDPLSGMASLAADMANTNLSTPMSAPLSQATATQGTKMGTKSAGMLKLPAELRRRIYRIVLVQPKKIAVTKSYKLPPLLQVCRAIRKETTSIYYNENKFSFLVHQYRGLDTVPFRRLLAKYQGPHVPNFFLDLCANCAVPDIQNLDDWLKEFHRDPENTPYLSQNTKAEMYHFQTLARRTFGVARVMKHRSWKEISEVLEAFYYAIEMLIEETDELSEWYL